MNITLEEQVKILQNTNLYLAMQVSQLSLENAMLKAEIDYHMGQQEKQQEHDINI